MAFKTNPAYMIMVGITEELLEELENDLNEYESRAKSEKEYQEMLKKGWEKTLKVLEARITIDKNASGLESKEYLERRKQLMESGNPRFILRNHLIDKSIKKAEQNDFEEVQKLLRAGCSPWTFEDPNEEYFSPPSDLGMCTKLSCSS